MRAVNGSGQINFDMFLPGGNLSCFCQEETNIVFDCEYKVNKFINETSLMENLKVSNLSKIGE